MATILIIDDEPEICRALTQMLVRAGFGVTSVGTAAEGVAAFEREPTDIVITDIIMPKIHGIDIIKSIRVKSTTARIIAISGGGNFGPLGHEPGSITTHAYLAAAVKMPRVSTRKLPAEYPQVTAGAIVLAPISDPTSSAGTVKLFILLLGGGALAIALLGLYLSHRRLMAQVDQIELGVTDIINGNVDRTFRPVGLELDGLANGLNVMLARLLGRPEPGEEELDDEGNPILLGRVEFDESEAGPDLDLAALAQESEPDYYKRVYTEYLAARRQTGSPDDVSFENFIAKLKVNEGKLKAQHQCRAVRFRVIMKDGKVTLKPVPIFA